MPRLGSSAPLSLLRNSVSDEAFEAEGGLVRERLLDLQFGAELSSQAGASACVSLVAPRILTMRLKL
jgi:hypothetical protein